MHKKHSLSLSDVFWGSVGCGEQNLHTSLHSIEDQTKELKEGRDSTLLCVDCHWDCWGWSHVSVRWRSDRTASHLLWGRTWSEANPALAGQVGSGATLRKGDVRRRGVGRGHPGSRDTYGHISQSLNRIGEGEAEILLTLTRSLPWPQQKEGNILLEPRTGLIREYQCFWSDPPSLPSPVENLYIHHNLGKERLSRELMSLSHCF